MGSMSSAMQVLTVSKTLQQVLGTRSPEPLAPPPAMPDDLVENFEAMIDEHTESSRKSKPVPSRQAKATLDDIQEEQESPSQSSAECASDNRAVPAEPRYTFLDSDSDVVNEAASEYTDNESGDVDNDAWRHDAATNVAVSDGSLSITTGFSHTTVPAPTFPPRTSSLLPIPRQHITETLPSGTGSNQNYYAGPVQDQEVSKSVDSYPERSSSPLKKAESMPVLFPPPAVQSQPETFSQPRHYHGSDEPYRTLNNASSKSTGRVVPSQPQTTTKPLPSMPPFPSKKRPLPSSPRPSPTLPLPRRRRRRDDLTTGLPTLPVSDSACWKQDFPGNTPALLTVLLTWSHTMWTLYRQVPDPALFSTHPAFPHRIAPPERKRLVSVAFYDTSVEPHREVRFLGPNDVAEMVWDGVDVFCDDDEEEEAEDGQDSSLGQSGEARWSYILIKGHAVEPGVTAPHVMLAWHADSITSVSDCLHTIFPDNDSTPEPCTESASKAPASHSKKTSKLKRLSSLPGMGSSLRTLAKSQADAKARLHKTLRAVNSASFLPSPSPVSNPPPTQSSTDQGWTLHRCVLKMEKAGAIPLIEGFRVDVAQFRGWMEACGVGKGKVMLWYEDEG